MFTFHLIMLVAIYSGGSRPSDKGGGRGWAVIQTRPKVRGVGLKKFFSAVWASFWSKYKGAAPPGTSHGSATDIAVNNYVWEKECLLK